LLEFASRWSVTILHLPTAYWRRLVDCVTSSLELPASLELTIVGGESPNWNEARMWRYFSSGSRLVHVYGPTEATITAAAYEVPAEAATGGGVPIGRAVSNTQLYVLDRDLGLQPPEVPGELYIGGESLARGYLNGPDLTAERFVPDPYSGQHGGRMYRTGDVARWSADGQVEFLGRRDREVKVRGYRIHPAEVEAALCLHSAVKECLVMTQKRSDTDELVAWVVPASDSQSGPRQIREFLCSKLPSWMTPSRIVFTDAFQRTSNGKIDRNAMAARDADIPPLLKDSRDPVEELIAAAWSEVLGIDDAAPDDSFFEFGGHSLSAMRVAAKLRRAFQIDVPLKWIFDRPTLRSLAREIRTALADSAVQAPDAPITPVSRDEWLPLSLGQERLWLLDLTLPGSPLFNMRFTAQLTGTLEEAALRQSVNEVVRRHESLRTRFAAVGDDVCQVISSEAAPPFLAVDLRVLPATAQPGEALRIVREQAAGSFNLAEDSPIRATLVRIDERDHVLLLVVHHIVCDGWSMDVLLSDLARCYNAYSAGRSPVLPPQPLQYADYAHWQRNWMETEAPRAHLDYWKETISPPLELLSLPRSSNTPAISELHMSSESLCLSPALTASLKRLSRRESATPFMTLLAAFKAMLSRYTPTPAVRVGVLSANRREGTEGMVGLFVNTLVLRTDLSGDPEFRKLLARVRETCLSAFAHDELPFDVLMYGLEREAGIRKKDAFEVMFVYQNSSGRSLELDGLAVLALTPEGIGDSGPVLTTADLVLIMQDSGPSLMAELKYKTNLFDPGTIAGMLHDLKRILERVIETPAARLADLAAPSAVPARARAAR